MVLPECIAPAARLLWEVLKTATVLGPMPGNHGAVKPGTSVSLRSPDGLVQSQAWRPRPEPAVH